MDNFEIIRQYAEKYNVPIMRPQTSKMIADFVLDNNPQNILEIGTAIGYSGCVMLSNSNAKLITIEHNEDYIKKAKQNFKMFGFTNRVKIISQDCLVTLANLAVNKKYNNYFDIIFLDGPKAQYEKMLELILILLKPNGTLIVDDVLFHGLINQEEKTIPKRFKTIITRMNLFIEKCKNSPKFSEFELKNIEDGVIFAKKV